MSKLRNRINRDLNAAINIAHALTRRMGWEDIPGELADAAGGVKPQPNAGSPQLQSGRLTVRIEKVNHAVNRGTVQHRIEEVVKM